jgi:UDP-N-acetylglucosamine diphosphorylase/glucosamine-1-phosphate N-acetyltransferase
MIKNLCIFEDDRYVKFLPLAYTRPVYDLRCGVFLLKDKILHELNPEHTIQHVRHYLVAIVKQWQPRMSVNTIDAETCLFVNGRVMVDDTFRGLLKNVGNRDVVMLVDDIVVLARVSGPTLAKIARNLEHPLTANDFDSLPKEQVQCNLFQYHWDLVHYNQQEIERDLAFLKRTDFVEKKKPDFSLYRGVHFINEENIFIDDGAVIKPGVVLDAEEGPILIGKDVKLFPNSTIIGPVSIGEKSMVKTGAFIYDATTIGPLCKVGGEIEASIIWGYSNKQHMGFLGHAYLGPWVNLGADTNNSDLKNNYGTVKVHVDGKDVDTGLQFVGLTMADHAKSGIDTMFNTGTVVGACCNIFGAGYQPKYVPSFTWGGTGEGMVTYQLEQSLKVAQRVMARRKVALTDVEANVLKKVFDITSMERRQNGIME